MCGSAKSSKAQQTAAQTAAEAERKAGEANLAAGLAAEKKILEAGQQTPEETTRLARYSAKATTPAEQLMTEAGPISQAIAQRILERSQQPGLDYNTQSAAFAEGVGAPLWRSLKARGIVAPPGAEGGGGLATQQYMKGAEPALAALRSAQINTDIATGQAYGTEARGLQQYYGAEEFDLAENLRNRLLEATMNAEQYPVKGIELMGQGQTVAEAINQAEVQSRYAKKDEEKAQIGKMVATIVLAVIGFVVGGPVGAMAGASIGQTAMGGGGGGGSDATNTALQLALKKRQGGTTTPTTPAQTQLSYRMQRPQTSVWETS